MDSYSNLMMTNSVIQNAYSPGDSAIWKMIKFVQGMVALSQYNNTSHRPTIMSPLQTLLVVVGMTC